MTPGSYSRSVMATNRNRDHADARNGHNAGSAGWIAAALGLGWMVGRALRFKSPEYLQPAREVPTPLPSSTRSARKGYEKRDASAGWIFGIVGFLCISGISIHLILAGWLRALNRTPSTTDQWRPNPRLAGSVPALGPFPRLQVSPPEDLETFRQREELELNNYGWVNKTSGLVRIPIERAMDLVLKEGLPVRQQTNETHTGPSSDQLIRQRLEHREQEIKTPE
jgi:hypothetical protein